MHPIIATDMNNYMFYFSYQILGRYYQVGVQAMPQSWCSGMRSWLLEAEEETKSRFWKGSNLFTYFPSIWLVFLMQITPDSSISVKNILELFSAIEMPCPSFKPLLGMRLTFLIGSRFWLALNTRCLRSLGWLEALILSLLPMSLLPLQLLSFLHPTNINSGFNLHIS